MNINYGEGVGWWLLGSLKWEEIQSWNDVGFTSLTVCLTHGDSTLFSLLCEEQPPCFYITSINPSQQHQSFISPKFDASLVKFKVKVRKLWLFGWGELMTGRIQCWPIFPHCIGKDKKLYLSSSHTPHDQYQFKSVYGHSLDNMKYLELNVLLMSCW